MKIRTSIVFFCLLMFITFTGCSSRNNSVNDSSTSATAKPQETTTTTSIVTTTTTTKVTTTPITTTTRVQELNLITERNVSKVLPVKNIQQMPEFPSGCEMTSTTIVLNYYGLNLYKGELINYMEFEKIPHGNNVWASPWEVFVGYPTMNYYGCYSPVIKKAVDKYFTEKKLTNYQIVDLGGLNISDLYDEIDAGNPVIIWGSIDMKPLVKTGSWYLEDGSIFTWLSKEHCVVLIGYNREKDTCIISDPWDPKGTVEYPREQVQKVYEQLEKQALVIHKVEN